MRQRWVPVAVLAAALFGINVVIRLVVRLGFNGNETVQNLASMVMFVLIGLVVAGLAFVRARQVPVSRWLPDMAAAVGTAMLLTILVGPFISGSTPFAGGAGDFFSQIWLYAGFAIGGTLLGYWIATAFGLDYRSRALQEFERSRLARLRQRRVVRR